MKKLIEHKSPIIYFTKYQNIRVEVLIEREYDYVVKYDDRETLISLEKIKILFLN